MQRGQVNGHKGVKLFEDSCDRCRTRLTKGSLPHVYQKKAFRRARVAFWGAESRVIPPFYNFEWRNAPEKNDFFLESWEEDENYSIHPMCDFCGKPAKYTDSDGMLYCLTLCCLYPLSRLKPTKPIEVDQRCFVCNQSIPMNCLDCGKCIMRHEPVVEAPPPA